MILQDYQVKRGGVRTNDKVYAKWLKDGAPEPYINSNPSYNGSMSRYKPAQMAFGAGTGVGCKII